MSPLNVDLQNILCMSPTFDVSHLLMSPLKSMPLKRNDMSSTLLVSMQFRSAFVPCSPIKSSAAFFNSYLSSTIISSILCVNYFISLSLSM